MANIVLYGNHPVFAAISNEKRNIVKILCTKDNCDSLRTQLNKYKRNAGLLNVVDKKEIEKLVPSSSAHQGIAAICQPLETYTIEDVIELSEDKPNCHVLVLDQVTDPQNVGAIIRSCVAFNTLALIVQDKNSPEENGAIAKASAGMIEHLPVCRVTNLSRALQQLKDANFWVIGMDGYAKTTVDKINKSGKNAIVMGSEGKGMRRLVEENCDMTIKLPISPTVESLNVSTAAAIVLYELNKG